MMNEVKNISKEEALNLLEKDEENQYFIDVDSDVDSGSFCSKFQPPKVG